jgi:hypothetical protein
VTKRRRQARIPKNRFLAVAALLDRFLTVAALLNSKNRSLTVAALLDVMR